MVVSHENITERKEAEERLVEAMRFAQSTIDALSAHLCVLDENGKILATNLAWRNFSPTGESHDPDVLPGANYLKVCLVAAGKDVRDAERFAEGIRSVTRGEREEFRMEYECNSPTEQHWFEGRVTRFPGEGPLRLVVAHEDISARKQAEAALREREEQLRLYAEHSPLAVAMFDCEMRYLVVSKRWLEEFDCGSQPVVVGRSHYEVFPNLPERWLDVHRRCLAGAVERCDEDEILRPDGTTDWIRWEVLPWRRANGTIGGIIIFSESITARKRAEEALRASQEQLRKVTENARIGLVMVNPERRYTFANSKYSELLGLRSGDLIGQRIADVLPDLYEEQIRPRLDQAFAGERPTYELRRSTPDGKRYYQVRYEPTLEGDRVTQVVVVLTEVTERKKLEEQFLRAQRMESIGTLAGGIAHDLNNTLSPILMALNLLEMRFTDPASAELISLIRDSAHHGANMVKQVLSFSRGIEGQRIGLQLHHLVREVEKIANDTFLKNIQVRTRVAHDLWTVLGDPTHLHQVLMNLCVNARDAMPQGGVLTISAENLQVDEHYAALAIEARPGPYVILRVEDTGVGMPPDVIENIFDPFFTTKEVGKGTGLGLSTTLAIVKSHGGFIRVQSALRQGTKFEIFLPAEPDHTAMTPEAADLGCPRGNGELVLVVDDEMAVRKITQQTLEAYGYRVLLASDGAEAVGVFSKHLKEVDVVLTDMTMPVMGGATAIGILHKMKPELPIVATSGLYTHGQKSRATELDRLGVKFFLEKPFGADVLLRAFRDALSTHA